MILAIDQKERIMRIGIMFWGLLLSVSLWAQYDIPKLIIEGAGANDVAVIDLDSDGDEDILLLKQDEHFNNGYWYENLDGQGNFDLPKLFDYFESELNTHLEIADLNGDGLLDIITNRQWIENKGAINTFENHIYVNGHKGYHYPADMDNDGDLDLLRTGVMRDGVVSSSNMIWMENTDGLGTFEIVEPFGNLGGPKSYKFINVIDFNGDNFVDVIGGYSDFSDGSSGYVVWNNTDGSGSNMQLEIDQLIADNSIFQIATGDVNGDGFDEFATIERPQSSPGQSTEVLFYNNNAGTFSSGILLQDIDAIYPQLEFVDIGNLGSPGLAVLDKNRDDFYRFSPNSNSTLFTGNTLPGAGGKGDFGDFNGDGKIDLAESSYVERDGATNTGDLYVNLSVIDGNGANPEEIIYHLRESKSGKVFDWDKSGSNDFITLEGGQTTKSVVWFSNDGAGNFSEKKILREDIGDMNSFWIADVNQDGLNDIIVDGPSPDAYAYYQNTNGELIPASGLFIDGSVTSMTTGDLNGDGFADFIYANFIDDELFWKENNGGIDGVVTLLDSALPESVIGLAVYDVNNDNQNDIILTLNDDNCYILYNQGSGNFSELQQVGNIENVKGFLLAHDLNKDGFIDLIFNAQSSLHLNSEKVVALLYDDPGNSYLPGITLLDEDDIDEIQFTDLDGDTDLDIFTDVGHAINISGFGDYFFNPTIGQHDLLYAMIDASKDIDGDGLPDLLRDPFSVTTWAKNLFAGATVLSGKVVIDENDNCAEDNGEIYLPNVLVHIENGGNSIYSNTSLQGYYGTLLPNLGDYSLEAITPSPYWSACETDTTITIADPDLDYEVDFHFQAEVDCPLLAPNISITRLRPCLPGAIVLNFCNYGTVDSEISQAELTIPAGITVDSVNHPVLSQTTSSIVFEIDPVAPGLCEGIFIFITPDCNQLQVGDFVCPQVNVTPDDLCVPINLNWDGSTIEASGTCVGDSARFVLKNIGNGAMNGPREMRVQIINDDIIMLIVDTFQLDPLGEKVITLLNVDQNALRIEADQDPLHPIANPAAAMVENCQGLMAGLWNDIIQSFPQYNGDPFNDITCVTLTGSYDPNEKIALPTGFGDEHLIEKHWPLDYTIYFQNTGNDTAFTVEIIDTISPYLDLSTLRVANGSHPFVWNIGPNNALTFTFDDIALPDSTIDLLGSQGFIKYSIKPKADAPFNQRIENRAAIYFDFNEPIITNTTFHTIQKPLFTSSEHITLCAGESYEDLIIQSDTSIQELFEFAEYDSLAFHHIDVNPVYLIAIDTSLEEGTIYQGVLIDMDTTLMLETTSVHGCDSMVISNISVIINSDETISLNQKIQVYPNPAKSNIHAQWNSLEVDEIEVFNVSGKLMKREVVGVNALEMNVEGFPSGLYHIHFKGIFGTITKRFIKLK